jgi:hypothetical protein
MCKMTFASDMTVFVLNVVFAKLSLIEIVQLRKLLLQQDLRRRLLALRGNICLPYLLSGNGEDLALKGSCWSSHYHR